MADRLVAIIPTRLNSTRFPGKALAKFMGRTALDHIVSRIRAAGIENIVLATTQCYVDLALVSLAKDLGVHAFAGDEYNVTNRFFRAAVKFGAEHIVRITHDCPVIDPKIIKLTVDHYFEEAPDYCASRLDPHAYQDGMDVEVFTMDALAKAYAMSEGSEHVTDWIKEIGLFECIQTLHDKVYDEHMWKLSLDDKEDYLKIKRLYEALYPKNPVFGLQEIEDEIGRWDGNNT